MKLLHGLSLMFSGTFSNTVRAR